MIRYFQEVRYTVFHPGGEQKTRVALWPIDPAYDIIVGLVEPFLQARLEHVNVLYEGKYTDMFVGEFSENLPRNDAATAIYRNNWLSAHPEADPESLSHISGPAVLFHKKIW